MLLPIRLGIGIILALITLSAFANPYYFTFTTQIPYDNKGYIIAPLTPSQAKPEKVVVMPIVPHKRLAMNLTCYQKPICMDHKYQRFKGLRCCKKQDGFFQRMATDKINYVAETKQWAKIWQNYKMTADLNEYSLVNGVKINHATKQFVPPPHTQKHIAKVYLHFQQNYQIAMTHQEINMYRAWG